jgi:3',5'-cyclic AMP phosphodiesterase CpdA
MTQRLHRREFLRLSALGGVAFASALGGCRPSREAREPAPQEDFYFLQLSDLHWGFQGPPNPDARRTLPDMVATIRAIEQAPAFVVLTGDLTHTTEDPTERRARMHEVRAILDGLAPRTLRFLPGEHDASLDAGEAFREVFGETRWSFDQGGIHFVGLDNVSDPKGALGDAQLAWLRADLASLPDTAPVVVFAHRPLFDLYSAWDWTTADGASAIALLDRFERATVFYGHIHQTHHHVTGRVAHHAAQSLIFPLPAPGSAPKRAPVPWDPNHPRRGLGYRHVGSRASVLSSSDRDVSGKDVG